MSRVLTPIAGMTSRTGLETWRARPGRGSAAGRPDGARTCRT
jgi:hypothetical protein